VDGRRLIASRRLPFHCACDNECHDLAQAEKSRQSKLGAKRSVF
jgi:hypothetical protein